MTQVQTTEQRYQADFQALEQRLYDEPAWLRQLRGQAWARFTELGFPTARRGNEAWKYTNAGPIARTSFAYAAEPDPAGITRDDLKRLAPWHDLWTTLVFVDGRYAASLSGGPHTEGARVTALADALSTDSDVVEKHLTRYASPTQDGFTALNTAFIHDGALIHVPEGSTLSAAVHLLFVTTGGAARRVTHPRTLIVAERESRVTVVESYVGLPDGGGLTNAVTEIAACEGAQIRHYRLLREHPHSFHVGTSRVVQGRDSTVASTSFATGYALARNDFHVLLDAPGASCTLNGLYMTWDEQHIDNHIGVDHAKPHTSSRLSYKGILDGSSRAVFSGGVLVRPGAQKTDARQDDRNLLLSQGAEVDSKPSLEIFADDVKCFHGATSGRIDADALFYMMSRGLSEKTARDLLIRAFAREIVETVWVEPLRDYLEESFLGALPGWRDEG